MRNYPQSVKGSHPKPEKIPYIISKVKRPGHQIHDFCWEMEPAGCWEGAGVQEVKLLAFHFLL